MKTIHYTAKFEKEPLLFHGSFNTNATIEVAKRNLTGIINRTRKELAKKIKTKWRLSPDDLQSLQVYTHDADFDSEGYATRSDEVVLWEWRKGEKK